MLDALHGLHGMGVIAIGHHAEGGHFGKLMKGLLNVRQILEVVQVVCFHIQHHSQRGEEIQKGIAILTAFQHNGIAVTHPVARMEQRQVAANHHCGIHIGLHENMGHHRGSSRFAVSARDADGIFIGLHNLAPGLCPLEYRNTGAAGSGNLRVVVMSCSSADDTVSAPDIFCPVTNVYMDAFFNQLIRGQGRAHIRAGNLQPHPLEHQSQGAHGNAADANEVHPLARNEILGNITSFHKK